MKQALNKWVKLEILELFSWFLSLQNQRFLETSVTRFLSFFFLELKMLNIFNIHKAIILSSGNKFLSILQENLENII